MQIEYLVVANSHQIVFDSIHPVRDDRSFKHIEKEGSLEESLIKWAKYLKLIASVKEEHVLVFYSDPIHFLSYSSNAYKAFIRFDFSRRAI
jgi:hypothetical protein